MKEFDENLGGMLTEEADSVDCLCVQILCCWTSTVPVMIGDHRTVEEVGWFSLTQGERRLFVATIAVSGFSLSVIPYADSLLSGGGLPETTEISPA